MCVGIDVHRRECHATWLNEDGEKFSIARFPTNLGALTAWARTLPQVRALALQASTVAERLYWRSTKLEPLANASRDTALPRRKRALLG